MEILNKLLKSTKHDMINVSMYFLFKNKLNKSSLEQLIIHRKVDVSFFFSNE